MSLVAFSAYFFEYNLLSIMYHGCERSMQSIFVNLLGIGLVAMHATASATFGGVVFVGGLYDLNRYIDGDILPLSLSRCEAAVDEAVEIGLAKVAFLPTAYWLDSGPADPPPGFDPLCREYASDLNGYYCYDRYRVTNVSHFCLSRTAEDVIKHSCQEPTAREMRVWQLLMARCIHRASEKGLDIEINIRVDDGRTLQGWRNTILFSPTTLYGQYSYETAFIEPLVEILSTTDYKSKISLTVAGEMGASLTHYADQWLDVISRVREQLNAARQPKGAPPIQVGVQINHNKVCGCHSVGFVGSYEDYLSTYESFDTSALNIDVDSFVHLLKKSDFVGISAYIAIEDPYSIRSCEFEELLARLDDELVFFNTSIADITNAGTRIQFSETGVGGGASQDGRTPATSASEAAQRPYWGIQGPPNANRSNDPFRLDLCDSTGNCLDRNEIREYRRSFYRAFSDYLTGQGDCAYDGYIDDVFLWSTGSWDVVGLYRPDRNWVDPVVIQTIVEHNAAVMNGGP